MVTNNKISKFTVPLVCLALGATGGFFLGRHGKPAISQWEEETVPFGITYTVGINDLTNGVGMATTSDGRRVPVMVRAPKGGGVAGSVDEVAEAKYLEELGKRGKQISEGARAGAVAEGQGIVSDWVKPGAATNAVSANATNAPSAPEKK